MSDLNKKKEMIIQKLGQSGPILEQISQKKIMLENRLETLKQRETKLNEKIMQRITDIEKIKEDTTNLVEQGLAVNPIIIQNKTKDVSKFKFK